MVARVVNISISFCKQPKGPVSPFRCWCVYCTDSSKLVTIWMWQTQFDCYWYQSTIVLQEQDSSCGVYLGRSFVYASQKWHQWIMVI